MSDRTSRMVALLGRMRRERNGAVADAMAPYGAAYGLNYGVSLPTVRSIARAEGCDPVFARLLYRQDVRELRLAALHIADPAAVTAADADTWAAGIVNSEVAEEAAFALLSRMPALPAFFALWGASSNPLLQYAVLLAAARSEATPAAWAVDAVEIVRRNAMASAVGERTTAGRREATGDSGSCGVETPVAAGPTIYSRAVRLTAQGAVALLAALGGRSAADREAVRRAVDTLGDLPAEVYVREELAWRIAESDR